MGRKVLLLYMSQFRFSANDPKIRTQTNEAAVRELL